MPNNNTAGSVAQSENSYASTLTNSQTVPANWGKSQQGLDLRTNDNGFHVIAQVIVDKFKDQLEQPSFVLSNQDKQNLTRLAPEHIRPGLVDAVQYRFQNGSPASKKPIDILARNCYRLGLSKKGSENPLYAPAGTTITLQAEKQQSAVNRNMQSQLQKMQQDVAQKTETNEGSTESLARQQLLAELREASTLMAESVTPEAAQFWRKHVVELQARLRSLHKIEGDDGNVPDNAEDIMRTNERLLASLQENTGYVPPKDDQFGFSGSVASPRSPMSSSISRDQSRTFQMDPSMEEAPFVDVVAPADLPGGYTFEAEMNDTRFLATVPAGGVKKGETFSCFMKDLSEGVGPGKIPIGSWRDGLFDCFKHGIFHPMLWNSFFCPLFALSQVMTRLGLDYFGKRVKKAPTKSSLSARSMCLKVLGFWIFLNSFILMAIFYKRAHYLGTSGSDIASLIIVNGFMFFYMVYVTANTRQSLREKYAIPEQRCVDLEDNISSIACLPCTIAQMGRHTANYADTKAKCCNDTGLPYDVQTNLPSDVLV